MKKVTIILEEETTKWGRVEAAKSDASVTPLVGDLLRQQLERTKRLERAWRSYTGRPSVILKPTDSLYPTRDEIHSR